MTAQPASAIDSAPYFPITPGSAWNYLDGGNFVTETATGFGPTVSQLLRTDGQSLVMANDASGIRAINAFQGINVPGTGFFNMFAQYSPPLVYAASDFQIGVPAASSGEATLSVIGLGVYNLNYSATSVPEAMETITVPAGTVDTVRFRTEVFVAGYFGTQFFTETITFITWAAPGIGRVKYTLQSGGVTETAFLTGTNLGALPDVPRDDVVAGFPGSGPWMLMNNSSWIQLHPFSPQSIAVTDLDKSGKDELLFGFYPYGMFSWTNNASWQQIHPITPEVMAPADLDGNGDADVAVDFGPYIGIWAYLNGAAWEPLHPLSPEAMVAAGVDNNTQDDLAVDFGPFAGLWLLLNQTTWQQIHPISPDLIESADLDNNGLDDVIADLGPFAGLWAYMNHSTWVQLHPLSISSMTEIDLDDNGQDDLVVEFGPGIGIWVWLNNGAWVQLNPFSASNLASGDLDNNGADDLVTTLGAFGLFALINNSTWVQLFPFSPNWITTAGR